MFAFGQRKGRGVNFSEHYARRTQKTKDTKDIKDCEYSSDKCQSHTWLSLSSFSSSSLPACLSKRKSFSTTLFLVLIRRLTIDWDVCKQPGFVSVSIYVLLHFGKHVLLVHWSIRFLWLFLTFKLLHIRSSSNIKSPTDASLSHDRLCPEYTSLPMKIYILYKRHYHTVTYIPLQTWMNRSEFGPCMSTQHSLIHELYVWISAFVGSEHHKMCGYSCTQLTESYHVYKDLWPEAKYR